jgi:hypothetical protein
MQREGHVERNEHRTSVLVPRQDLTGADRQWAARYEAGDVVRYSRGSRTLGVEAGDYARVERVDDKANQVTVRTDDARTVSYDPRRLQGVTVYREAERAFARGDRVQATAPDRGSDVANRELGTVEWIGKTGRMDVRASDSCERLAKAVSPKLTRSVSEGGLLSHCMFRAPSNPRFPAARQPDH